MKLPPAGEAFSAAATTPESGEVEDDAGIEASVSVSKGLVAWRGRDTIGLLAPDISKPEEVMPALTAMP